MKRSYNFKWKIKKKIFIILYSDLYTIILFILKISIGWCLTGLKNYIESISFYEKAIELD